jgi:hypothetical protein
MMNRKQMTLPLAIAGIGLLATVLAMTSPTQALALGHWNLDEDFIPGAGIAEDSAGTADNSDGEDEEDTTAATNDEDEESEDSGDESSGEEDSSHTAYDDFQACLSNVEGEESPTEQQVDDCMESSYEERDSNEEDATESASEDEEDETEMSDEDSKDDTQNEEDEDN